MLDFEPAEQNCKAPTVKRASGAGLSVPHPRDPAEVWNTSLGLMLPSHYIWCSQALRPKQVQAWCLEAVLCNKQHALLQLVKSRRVSGGHTCQDRMQVRLKIDKSRKQNRMAQVCDRVALIWLWEVMWAGSIAPVALRRDSRLSESEHSLFHSKVSLTVGRGSLRSLLLQHLMGCVHSLVRFVGFAFVLSSREKAPGSGQV